MLERIRRSKLLFWSIELLIIVLILNGLMNISFVFQPIATFFSTWLVPLVTGLFLYYIFNPLIKLMEKIHIKRGIAVPLLFLGLVGLIVLAFFSLVPSVVHQVSQLVSAIPDLITELRTSAAKASNYRWYSEFHVDDLLKSLDSDKLIKSSIKSFSAGVPSLVGSVAGMFFSIITIPMLFFYMLNDGKKFVPSVQRLFPARYQDDVGEIFSRMDDTLAHYISGQAIECVFVGTFMFIGYTIIGQPYGLLLALVSGVTTLIPYIGPYIGITPGLLIAATLGWKQILLTIAIMIVVQTIDGNFIYPNVIGRSLDVHPLTIIIILLVVNHLYGIIGTILAVPVYAVVKTIAMYIWRLIRIEQKRQRDQTVKADATAKSTEKKDNLKPM